MVYRFRDNRHPTAKSQAIGERLALIADRHGGHVPPGAVIEDARGEDSPMHSEFTWSDRDAAVKCREDEARRLIASIVVVELADDGRVESEGVAYVSVARSTGVAGYMAAARVFSDEELGAGAILDAKAQLRGWQRRFRHLEKLAAAGDLRPIFEAIDGLPE